MTNETQLTPEEKALLQQIVNDKFAIGPFSGMIFNAITSDASKLPSGQEPNVDAYIKNALIIRLRLQKLAE